MDVCAQKCWPETILAEKKSVGLLKYQHQLLCEVELQYPRVHCQLPLVAGVSHDVPRQLSLVAGAVTSAYR